ncbi:unnamed protein product [Brassica oleracea var. botrytis]
MAFSRGYPGSLSSASLVLSFSPSIDFLFGQKSLEVAFSVVVVEFPVDSGGFIALFGSVEEIEVGKDSGVSCFRDDSGRRWRIPVYRRLRTGLDPRGGESDGGMGDTWLLRCWS